MDTKSLQKILLSLAFLGFALALRPVSSSGSTFSDANWSSMGGFPGVNGTVYATAVDGAGNPYIGGDRPLGH